MFQIDAANSQPTLQGAAPPGAPGFFEDTATGCIVSADWLNAVQCEIANVIEAAGITLEKPPEGNTDPADPSLTQLLAALKILIPELSGAPGDIKMTGAVVAPAGWLLMQGQAISRTTYAALWVALGSPNTGDGVSTFTLPDFRGMFPRGFDAGADVDPGRALLSAQADALASHNHRNGVAVTNGSAAPFVYGTSTTDIPGAAGSTAHTDSNAPNEQGLTSSSGGAAETRPKNIAVNFIIKV